MRRRNYFDSWKTIFEEVCYSTSLQLVEGDQSLKFTIIQIWSAPKPTRACGRGRGNYWESSHALQTWVFSAFFSFNFWCCFFFSLSVVLVSIGIKPRPKTWSNQIVVFFSIFDVFFGIYCWFSIVFVYSFNFVYFGVCWLYFLLFFSLIFVVSLSREFD